MHQRFLFSIWLMKARPCQSRITIQSVYKMHPIYVSTGSKNRIIRKWKKRETRIENGTTSTTCRPWKKKWRLDSNMLFLLRYNNACHVTYQSYNAFPNRVVEPSNIKPSNVNDSGAKIGTSDGRPPAKLLGRRAGSANRYTFEYGAP